ncbi:MAG: folate-binding protein [Nocardioides sp.]
MSANYRSPLLDLPGAVEADRTDAGVAAHYGSFNVEQRALVAGEGFVDLSHRDIVRIAGPDRLTWLHNLTTQHLLSLEPGAWTSALILSPQGHVEHAFTGCDDGTALTVHTEPGAGAALIDFLDRMRFMMDVSVAAVADLATMWRPGLVDPANPNAGYEFVPCTQLGAYAAALAPAAGLWAFEALRIARGEPRLGVDTDHRTIPNEVGWIPSAVHLDKGCYRGQETVARVHTLGRPPRRLTRLHLDGSENTLPAAGTALRYDGRDVGFVGSSARHFEQGPIALALVKRNVPLDAVLELATEPTPMPATQEVIVDPEIGLHVRPRL